MSATHKVLNLSSCPKSIAKVEPFVNTIVDRYHISQDIYGNILISITEAVTNAIRHGNRNDASKNVSIRVSPTKDGLSFLISDEGNGFDYQNVPDPTAPENILKIGGRGVFLMRQLADQVQFTNNGSTVEIQFRLS